MSWPSIDHSILSPSGHVSKRARKAALARETKRLFPEGMPAPQCQQESKREYMLRRARLLEDLAARGMHPRKYKREAKRLREAAEVTRMPGRSV